MATKNYFGKEIFTEYKPTDPVYGVMNVPEDILFDGNDFWAKDLFFGNKQEETKLPIKESVNFDLPDEDNGVLRTMSNKFNFNISKDLKTKALYIMDLLINKYKRSAHLAAGIVGNLVAESKLNTDAYNGNDLGLPSGGIAQWNGPNFSKLKAYAKERGKSWKDLDLQIDFLNSTIDNDVNNRLLSSTNPLEASKAWAYYEKFAGYDGTTKTAQKLKKSKGWTEAQTLDYINKEHSKRGNYANEIFNLWQSQLLS